MKKPIRIEVINDGQDHFAVYFNRPGRVEISLVRGRIVVCIYSGVKVNPEQAPLACLMEGNNKGWKA